MCQSQPNEDKPAVEIHYDCGNVKGTLKIWENGRMEGWPLNGKVLIVNRIPRIELLTILKYLVEPPRSA